MPSVVPVRKLDTGWALARVHHSIVPDYDFEDACKGLSPDQVEMELEINWNASSGKRVYPLFGPIHQATEPLLFDPRLPLVLGWDLPGANGGTPACVVSQLSLLGQWFLYGSLQPDEDEQVGIGQFAHRVEDWLRRLFADPAEMPLERLGLRHYGDPAGNQKPPKTLGASKIVEQRAAFELVYLGASVVQGYDRDGVAHYGLDAQDQPIYTKRKARGWRMQAGEISLTKRMESVHNRLDRLLPGGLPALVVDPDAGMILEGFQGGYCYRQRADGRYELDPDKNVYSHPFNALEYACSRLGSAGPDTEPNDGSAWRGTTRGIGSPRGKL